MQNLTGRQRRNQKIEGGGAQPPDRVTDFEVALQKNSLRSIKKYFSWAKQFAPVYCQHLIDFLEINGF